MIDRNSAKTVATDAERLAALAYVTALYQELSQENGAATLGTQNQVVEFILGDAALVGMVRRWAAGRPDGSGAPEPPQRLPRDASYRRIRAAMAAIMEEPVFRREERRGSDG